MRKGIANEMVLVMVIVVGIAFLASSLALPRLGGQVSTLRLREDIYTLDNALQAAKLYTETALDYSVYQACYDGLDFGENIPKESEFSDSLGSGIESNINTYTADKYNFISGVPETTLPRYKISLDLRPSYLTVSASGNDFEIIQKVENKREVGLWKDSALEKRVDIPCLDMFRKAAELNRSLHESFMEKWEDVVEGYPDRESVTVETENPPDTGTDEEKIMEYVMENSGDDKLRYGASAAAMFIHDEVYDFYSGVLDYDYQEKEYTLKDNPEITVDWTGDITVTIEPDECSIIQTEKDGKSIVEAECNFLYRATSDMVFEINGTEKYPVYDGKQLSYQPVRASFKLVMDETAEGGPPPPDTEPPVVSDIETSVTGSSVTITWTTDEDSTAVIEHGKTEEYGDTLTLALSPRKEHEATITGLDSGTVYHFRIVSTDESDNTGRTEDRTFTTK